MSTEYFAQYIVGRHFPTRQTNDLLFRMPPYQAHVDERLSALQFGHSPLSRCRLPSSTMPMFPPTGTHVLYLRHDICGTINLALTPLSLGRSPSRAMFCCAGFVCVAISCRRIPFLRKGVRRRGTQVPQGGFLHAGADGKGVAGEPRLPFFFFFGLCSFFCFCGYAEVLCKLLAFKSFLLRRLFYGRCTETRKVSTNTVYDKR